MTREPAEPMQENRLPTGAELDAAAPGHPVFARRGEAHRAGGITPGKLADLVAYPIDPLTGDVDDLADLRPTVTMVGGLATHDPDKRLAR